MPKRTKREKIRADRLRSTSAPILSKTQLTQSVTSPNNPSSLTPTYQLPHLARPQGQSQYVATTDAIEFTEIKKDIIKTVILAALAIGTELFLYWKIGT